MHGEIVLAALVLVVAILVAADFFRRTSDASHEHPAGTEPGNERGPAHDTGRETYPAGIRPDRTRQDRTHQDSVRPDSARQDRGAVTLASAADPGGPQVNWLVRTRLGLLAAVSAAAAALATAGFIRAAGAFRRASADSNVMHDGAIVSAILALFFATVILVAGCGPR
jgi:hypothetical protein